MIRSYNLIIKAITDYLKSSLNPEGFLCPYTIYNWDLCLKVDILNIYLSMFYNCIYVNRRRNIIIRFSRNESLFHELNIKIRHSCTHFIIIILLSKHLKKSQPKIKFLKLIE